MQGDELQPQSRPEVSIKQILFDLPHSLNRTKTSHLKIFDEENSEYKPCAGMADHQYFRQKQDGKFKLCVAISVDSAAEDNITDQCKGRQ
jgi:hypothetical protein